MSRLEQRKRERENKAAMEADLQVALAEKEVIAQQVRCRAPSAYMLLLLAALLTPVACVLPVEAHATYQLAHSVRRDAAANGDATQCCLLSKRHACRPHARLLPLQSGNAALSRHQVVPRLA